MPPTEAEVVVVGAGAAGLAVGATLSRRGRRPVILERDDEIGAVWAGRYERLRLHTVRRFSGLPYYGLPSAEGRYVTKDAYAAYLSRYARALRLDVRVAQPVTSVRGGDQWTVESADETWRAAAVVIATGRYNRLRLPDWPGLREYRGDVVHSAAYRTGRDYAGRRALVVGIGNSGAEIATDLVEQGAASVDIAVRTSPPIAKRETFGIPVQLLGMALAPLPPRPVDRLGAAARRLAIGDLAPYGLGAPAWGPFEARRPPVIDVGFLAELKRRSIRVQPGVERLTEREVVFADGRAEEYDVVIAATGFTSGLDDLVDAPGAVVGGLPAPNVGDVAPGLYFIGFRESPRGALFEANREARRLARSIDEYLRRALGHDGRRPRH